MSSPEFRIAPMSPSDLSIAADWAAAEGWNPGLEDTAAFHAVDPDGFLMGWLGDQPVTAISVVRHSATFGFLGFYLCHPDHRGQGYGWQTWQAGIAHLGNRVVGLDGVPAQQENYRKSGFDFAHQTQRFGGAIAGREHAGHDSVTPDDLTELLELDQKLSGVERRAYLSAWFTQTAHRTSLIHREHGILQTVGTIRKCREGHKIGPLYTADPDAALRMIEALVHAAHADQVYIDVPNPNESAVQLMERLSLRSAFSCSRMYRGEIVPRDLNRIYAEVSFELG